MQISKLKREANKSSKSLSFDLKFFGEEKRVIDELVRKYNLLIAKIKHN